MKKNPNILCRLLQCILGKVFSWMLKREGLSYLQLQPVPVVWLLVSKGSWSACPAWQGNLKLSFSGNSRALHRLCLWLLVSLLCCFPCWRREQRCLPRGTLEELLIPERGGQDDGECAVGSISNPITRCCGQAVTFEKEVPRFEVTWELAGLWSICWSKAYNQILTQDGKSHLNLCH